MFFSVAFAGVIVAVSLSEEVPAVKDKVFLSKVIPVAGITVLTL